MRPILIFATALPLLFQAALAQTPPVTTPPATPAPPAEAQTAPPAAAATAPASAPASSVPSSESWLKGWIEAGYRWDSGPNGSVDTYRSIVNLGSGLKLTGMDFTITDKAQRFFDFIHVRASDWPDPYSDLHLFAVKRAVYHFDASYRSLAYFNNLPSFADPLQSHGIQIDEQSFDSRRHLTSMELQLFPESRISPFFGFDHDGETGHGITAFQSNDNEYPAAYTETSVTSQFRGGVNIVLPRVHLTLEEGGTTWRNNEFAGSNAFSLGNSQAPILGQTLDNTALQQAWGIRGSGVYSRVALTASPVSWADVYGHFGYSDPHNNVNYSQYDTGNQVLLTQALFYNGEQFLLGAAARMPHTTGDIGGEIRPLKRVRLDEHWLTDRTHDAGSTNGADTLLANGQTAPLATLANAFSSFLASNYNELETGVSVDVTNSVRVRGAYRHVWGDANDLVLPQTGLYTVENSKLDRNVALGSASWRVSQKFLASADFEWGTSASEYYRTSLYDYKKVRVTGRYDLTSKLRVSVDYRILTNKNPLAGSPYKSLQHQESVALQWTPPVKNSTLDVAYEHCGFQTRMWYFDPTYLTTTFEDYRENCHDVSATATFAIRSLKVTAGGNALVTSGSRPTSYYQPTVRLSAPVTRNVAWFALWQYYGFGETFYAFENFQTNLFTTGLRFTK